MTARYDPRAKPGYCPNGLTYNLDSEYLTWVSKGTGLISVAFPASPAPISHVGGGSETESKCCSAYKQVGVV